MLCSLPRSFPRAACVLALSLALPSCPSPLTPALAFALTFHPCPHCTATLAPDPSTLGAPPSPLRARPSPLTRCCGGGLAPHGAPAVRSAARAPRRVRPGTGSSQRLQLGTAEGWVLGVPVRALMRMYGLCGSVRGHRSAAPAALGARRPARAQVQARAHVGRHPHAHAHAHRRTHVRTHEQTHTLAHSIPHSLTHTHTHTRTHTHAHTRARTHKHTPGGRHRSRFARWRGRPRASRCAA